MNDNGWEFTSQIRVNDRAVGVYKKDNQVQLRYQSTGHVIVTTTLPGWITSMKEEISREREENRYIITRLTPILGRTGKDELDRLHNMAGQQEDGGASIVAEMPGLRRPGVGTSSCVLSALPESTPEHQELVISGREHQREIKAE